MAEANVIRVRVCRDCGEVGSSMDTMCQRCLRHGTLEDRYQCLKCRSVMEERSCPLCSHETAVREGTDMVSAPPVLRGGPDELEIPSVARAEPPPWLAGLIGGAVLGAGAGAIAATFFAESALFGALVGLVPGALAGAFLTTSSGGRK